MKEFVEKLIARLEEEQKEAQSDGSLSFAMGFKVARLIVNELAEEYKHCALCYLQSPCEYQNESVEMPKEYWEKGWIPCSERLPSERDWYLAVFKEGDSDFVLVPRVADYIGKETVCTTNEGWLIIDLEDEIGINAYYKNLVCIAWQPLPAPYKECERQ